MIETRTDGTDETSSDSSGLALRRFHEPPLTVSPAVGVTRWRGPVVGAADRIRKQREASPHPRAGPAHRTVEEPAIRKPSKPPLDKTAAVIG